MNKTFISLEPFFGTEQALISKGFEVSQTPLIQLGYIQGWSREGHGRPYHKLYHSDIKLLVGYKLSPDLGQWRPYLSNFRTATCTAGHHQFKGYDHPNEVWLTVWYHDSMNFNFSEPNKSATLGEWLAYNIEACVTGHWKDFEWQTTLHADGSHNVEKRRNKPKAYDFLNPRIKGQLVTPRGFR